MSIQLLLQGQIEVSTTSASSSRAQWSAADFLLHLIKVIPYKIHTVLTDNGTHFTNPKDESRSIADIKGMLDRGKSFRALAFGVACALNNIDHRLTKPKHP